MAPTPPKPDIDDLNPKGFFADIVGALSGTLQEVVGMDEASAFVARVGDDMGRSIADRYRDDDGALPAEPAEIGRILCDLKQKIGGHFELIEAGPDKLVFTASSCPFGRRVEGRPSLCMMTTNVFGRIAAEANGYASVEIDEALSIGHSRCHVTVHLVRNEDADLFEFFA
ncbi:MULTISPECIES: methanogen output domain 1-containing protein [unclassified Mameliella]|uniref:methanogen output domain 1-containing protein n=1 Tax=unclassified Mameliella TaxID=2630630 RepID=UPI00273E5E3D|nr:MULTISPECIES: methanogen output domain 1-containing protein [unclassified Mameliella]